MKRAIGLTYKEAPRAALCPNHYSHMADPAPIISYATPEPAARRGQPIFWWLLVDFILMIAFVVALFAVEPERSIDPPASPGAEAVLIVMLVAWLGLFIGICVWACRIGWSRRRACRCGRDCGDGVREMDETC